VEPNEGTLDKGAEPSLPQQREDVPVKDLLAPSPPSEGKPKKETNQAEPKRDPVFGLPVQTP
jgi:hypothetical protein